MSDVERDLKARQEGHDFRWYLVGGGHYACVHGGNAYVLSVDTVSIGCSCPDMTYHCREGEVCKHVIAFNCLMELPSELYPAVLDKLFRADGWTGDRLLAPPVPALEPVPVPPKETEKPVPEPEPPTFTEIVDKVEKTTSPEASSQIERLSKNRKRSQAEINRENMRRFDGLTPSQMCEMMDDKELRMNARKGGVAAIAELEKRRKEE